MRQYYTLVQPFILDGETSLDEYLAESGIKVEIGADLSSELAEFGFKKPDEIAVIKCGRVLSSGFEDPLLKKYVVLLEEHEITAIRLSINNVQVLENRPAINLQNKLRGCFSWLL